MNTRTARLSNAASWFCLASVGLVIATAAAASGCATVPETAVVNGVEVVRPTLRFTGQPYSIEHYHAHPVPGGPSEGLVADGGWIGGQVCRDNVLYFVEHHGEHVVLEGYVGGSGGAWLVVRDVGGRRSIHGRNAELWLTPDSLSGTYADRPVRLERTGSKLAGRLGEHKMVMRHADVLWSMPAADQAVVIDELLRCDNDALRARNQTPAPGTPKLLVVGLGGEDTTYPVSLEEQ